MKTFACLCGAVYRFPRVISPATARKLLDVIVKQHQGAGHGECDLETARRARQKAERVKR